MYRRLESIDEFGTGLVMVYPSAAAADACQPPLRSYPVTATPSPGQTRFDALATVMAAQDPETD